ncbi:MAG TPA: insulinase family protein [Kofleriaceae bacterium]|jgi:zinc protease|nr:insulinase family protein [Kofleriaceae bacterium]
MFRLPVAGLVLAACGAQPFAPQAPEPPPRQTRIDLKIDGFRASNGARLVFVPDAKAREVQVTLRYRVGAIDDPPGQEGMAHLVEHLMYQKLEDGQSVFARLEALTSYFNGFTDLDTTTYVERGPASALEPMLAIETTRVTVPCESITEDVFEREREVVINERAQHGDLSGAIDALLYPQGHAYHRSIGGTEASLRSITRAQACAFAERHYGAAAAVLVVSGNVSEAAFKQSIAPLIAALPTRALEPSPVVSPVPAVGKRVVVPASAHAVLVAWPLPADPATAEIATAMAKLLAMVVGLESDSRVQALVLGGDRAPMILIGIELEGSDTVETVLGRVRSGLTKLRGQLGATVFEHTRQRATHLLFAEFEDGVARDLVLARHVEAGREAGDGFSRQVHAIGDVTYTHAQQIAEAVLDVDRATVIELEPSATVASTTTEIAALAAPIHQSGQPRLDADPADAHRAATAAGAPDPLYGARTRKLANGLSVVLLPMSSVPAVEMRLVFGVGTADDPRGQPGIAKIAAHAIGVDASRRSIATLLSFFAAGGSFDVRVERDRTTYAVDGIDMYLDVLLTGLAQELQSASSDALAKALAATHGDAHPASAWLAAIYGAGHPYAAPTGFAGNALDAAALLDFRDKHFTPDNATLVISGGFDPAVADAWVDYLFSSWTGRAAARPAPQATVSAASLAYVHDGAQVGLEVVIGAHAAGAAQLVAAEMANELVEDIRHQLGASYGIAASLVEQRLATHYTLRGDVETGRAVEAIGLIRDRLTQLRAGGNDLAGLFVRARARVNARLGSYRSGSAALAERVEHAIELGRNLHADAGTEGAVRALTLDGMAASLGELDLSRAAIRLTGPREVVAAMFAALGRTPVVTAE